MGPPRLPSVQGWTRSLETQVTARGAARDQKPPWALSWLSLARGPRPCEPAIRGPMSQKGGQAGGKTCFPELAQLPEAEAGCEHRAPALKPSSSTTGSPRGRKGAEGLEV